MRTETTATCMILCTFICLCQWQVSVCSLCSSFGPVVWSVCVLSFCLGSWECNISGHYCCQIIYLVITVLLDEMVPKSVIYLELQFHIIITMYCLVASGPVSSQVHFIAHFFRSSFFSGWHANFRSTCNHHYVQFGCFSIHCSWFQSPCVKFSHLVWHIQSSCNHNVARNIIFNLFSATRFSVLRM
jgi:hypothetical protein